MQCGLYAREKTTLYNGNVQLTSVTLQGYKRFGHAPKMNVDGKLVALVGPNEAGKTSFLDALLHLNDRTSFVASGGSRELTRGATVSDDQNIITGLVSSR